MILAIDPGPTESAYVRYQPSSHTLHQFGKHPNSELLDVVASGPDTVVIEMIASYGMPVGFEVFQTCVWIGRFAQAAEAAFGYPAATITRSAVKLQICGATRAKDGNVRQALIDRFGGDSHAVGKKAKPGPLYGVSGDVWAALAVAVTYAERTKVLGAEVAA